MRRGVLSLPVATVLLLCGCSGQTEELREAAPSDVASPSPDVVTGTGVVVLEVGGTVPEAESITHTDADLEASTEAAVALPWRTEVPAGGEGAAYEVTAQGAGEGEITCTITGEDGEVLVEQSASGPSAVVTCTS